METNVQVGTAIALVVQEGGPDSWLLWNELGVMAVAGSHAELGRWAIASLSDPKVPRVEKAARPGGGQIVRGIAGLLDKVAPPESGGDDERTAVHVVVYLAASSSPEASDVVVWAPKGPPRTARGPETLGKVLAALSIDTAQPRVSPGQPPDVAGEMVARGLDIAGKIVGDVMAEARGEP